MIAYAALQKIKKYIKLTLSNCKHRQFLIISIFRFRTNDDVLTLTVTPWSCCKLDFPMQCLHDPLQQLQYSHIWADEPSMVVNSINTKGCLISLKKPVTAIISIFIFLATLIFLLHVSLQCVNNR